MVFDSTRKVGSSSGEPSSIPGEARGWLKLAAVRVGENVRTADEFARTGVLNLEGVSVVMFRQQESPPRWVLLGYVRPPASVASLLWNEALLRANCVAMALGTCAFGVHEGSALLVKPMPFYHVDDAEALAEGLADIRDIATSLRVTVHAAATAGGVAHEPPSSDMTSVSPEFVQLKRRVDTLAEREMNAEWHRPLLEQALRTLGMAVPQHAVGSVGAFKVGKRYVEVIAAPDQRHLLLSTDVDLPLATLAQRHAALETNVQLMTNAHCGLALTPKGSSLQSRWDATGLDGEDLAGWLVDFMTLATAIGPGQAAHAQSVASHTLQKDH